MSKTKKTGKSSKQDGMKTEAQDLPSFVTDGVQKWTTENAAVLKNRWRRAELAYEIRQEVDEYNAKQEVFLPWKSIAAAVGEDRSTLNDDVAAMTLVSSCNLKVSEIHPKSYSAYVKLQRLKDASVRLVKKSNLQSKEMEAAIDEVEDLVNEKAKKAAVKDSPVRVPDVESLLSKKLVVLGVVKELEVLDQPQEAPLPKVDIRSLGLLDTAAFLDLLKAEFVGPTYRGCEVGVASATTEVLDEAGIDAALDQLKETAASIIPQRGQIWLCLRRKQVDVTDSQPAAA